MFFIHGGLNGLHRVVSRIERFSQEFGNEPWHLIHLAWDTSWGSSLDDAIRRLNSPRAWKNVLRIAGFLLPWNWFGERRILHGPAAYFGSAIWRSEYDTAVAATKAPGLFNRPMNRGFYRAFKYLDDKVRDGDDLKISFVVHSAGGIVANYLLKLIETDFRNLTTRISNYVLLAPSCHVNQFQDSLSRIKIANQVVVLTLTPEWEEKDNIFIYDKSLLWAIYDLFEAKWSQRDYSRLRIPARFEYPVNTSWNRAILGIEQLITDLETRDTDRLDRSLGGAVTWAKTGQPVSIGGGPPRVWTESTTHSMDNDQTTLDSIKFLLK